MSDALQAGIEERHARALAAWKLAIEHTRRAQGQRWRYLVVEVQAITARVREILA